jgi:hypothetical protein
MAKWKDIKKEAPDIPRSKGTVAPASWTLAEPLGTESHPEARLAPNAARARRAISMPQPPNAAEVVLNAPFAAPLLNHVAKTGLDARCGLARDSTNNKA